MTDQIIANVYTFILSGFLEFLKSFSKIIDISFTKTCVSKTQNQCFVKKFQTKSWSCQKKFHLIYVYGSLMCFLCHIFYKFRAGSCAID